MSAIRFGTDGWRAVIAEEFTFANIRLAAQGIADVLLAAEATPRVIIGFDSRFASEQFAQAVAEVLVANGLTVVLSDRIVPTPVVSYAVVEQRASLGIMITASHNPPMFNGLKVKSRTGAAASTAEVAAIEAAIDRRLAQGQPALTTGSGRLTRVELGPAYRRRLAELVELDALRAAGLTVIVDALYGAGAGQLPALLAGGTTQVAELHDQPHPLFPGLRGPEPVAANLAELGAAVRAQAAALGLALDGDGDRIGLVDERGQYVDQQQVFTLLTLYLIEQRGWRGTIVKSVNATTMLDRLAERYGLAVVTTPVGFKYLGPEFAARDGLIAGEESGGFALRGHLPERDGMLAGLYLLDLLRQRGRSVTALIADLQARLGPAAYDRLDLTFAPAERATLAERARAARPTQLAGRPVVDISHQDGDKFHLADGRWLLIRFSGTEPLLRLYAEGHTPSEVAELLQAGQELLGLA